MGVWGILRKQLSPGGGRLIIASDGVWDALSSEKAAKICRGEKHPEVAAKNVVKVCASPIFFRSCINGVLIFLYIHVTSIRNSDIFWNE